MRRAVVKLSYEYKKTQKKNVYRLGYYFHSGSFVNAGVFTGSRAVHFLTAKKMELFRSVIFKIAILAGVIMAVSFLYTSIKEIQRGRQIESEIETLRQEAGKIKTSNNNLQEKISYFATQEFQERAAKEKLNLQKSDEKVAIVRPSISREIIEENSVNDIIEFKEKNIPNYLKWCNQFFGY